MDASTNAFAFEGRDCLHDCIEASGEVGLGVKSTSRFDELCAEAASTLKVRDAITDGDEYTVRWHWGGAAKEGPGFFREPGAAAPGSHRRDRSDSYWSGR